MYKKIETPKGTYFERSFAGICARARVHILPYRSICCTHFYYFVTRNSFYGVGQNKKRELIFQRPLKSECASPVVTGDATTGRRCIPSMQKPAHAVKAAARFHPAAPAAVRTQRMTMMVRAPMRTGRDGVQRRGLLLK